MLTVTLDASKMTKWAEQLSTRGLRKAIRRVVDESATAARRVSVDVTLSLTNTAALASTNYRGGLARLRPA